MSYTKRQLVLQAFDDIGLAAYVFDLESEQLENAARKMDMMMATWNGKGIRVGYPITNGVNVDLDQDTAVPDYALEAISMNLGVRIAPSLGKAVAPEVKAAAKMAYDVLLQRAAMPPLMQLPDTMPAGAGNKPWRLEDDPFLSTPDDPLLAGTDGPIEYQ